LAVTRLRRRLTNTCGLSLLRVPTLLRRFFALTRERERTHHET
jgi:hypothetical protein